MLSSLVKLSEPTAASARFSAKVAFARGGSRFADGCADMSVAGPSELSQAAPPRIPVGALPLAAPARALLGLRGLNNLGNTCAASVQTHTG